MCFRPTCHFRQQLSEERKRQHEVRWRFYMLYMGTGTIEKSLCNGSVYVPTWWFHQVHQRWHIGERWPSPRYTSSPVDVLRVSCYFTAGAEVLSRLGVRKCFSLCQWWTCAVSCREVFCAVKLSCCWSSVTDIRLENKLKHSPQTIPKPCIKTNESWIWREKSTCIFRNFNLRNYDDLFFCFSILLFTSCQLYRGCL